MDEEDGEEEEEEELEERGEEGEVEEEGEEEDVDGNLRPDPSSNTTWPTLLRRSRSSFWRFILNRTRSVVALGREEEMKVIEESILAILVQNKSLPLAPYYSLPPFPKLPSFHIDIATK